MQKEIINTSDAPAAIGPYNQATAWGNTVYLSGQIALDPQTGELRMGSIEEELRQIFANIQAVLKAASSSLQELLKVSIFLSDMAYYEEVNRIYTEYFDAEQAPARECVAVKTLPKNVRIEIACIAARKA